MARTATTGKVAAAQDTNRGYGAGHGVGKMKFMWSPMSGISSGSPRSKDDGSGTRGAMAEKIRMRPPKGMAPGKPPTERTQFNKGLIVRGKKQLMG